MLWNQPDDSGFEESSEKLSEPRNSETWIENLSDDIDLQGEYETPEKRLEVEKKYGFAIKEGANILATLPDEEGALEKSSETTSDDDSPSKNWALKSVTSVVKANAPTENVFNVYDSKDFHCGDVVNVTKKVVVEIINPQPSEKDDQESIETDRKKLSTTIKGVAAGVLSILVLVIIIVIVEITQLQNSGGGEKPTYKPATPKDDTYDTEDHSGPGNVSWVSRKTCGLQNPTKYVNVTSLPLPSDSIIVSHTVTPECSSQETCCSRVASVQARMMTWSYDIGYHFLVGSDGNIYEGRQWDQEGAHTKGANCKLGVAFIGNFMDKTPIEKQVDASFKLFDGLVLANLLTPNYTIFGQNDVGFNPTESPGKVLIELMKNWPHYRKEDQIVRGPCYKKIMEN